VPRAKVDKGGPLSSRLSRPTDQFVGEEKLRENRRPLGELKQLYPFFISRKTNRGAESCAFCSTRRLA